MESCQRSFRIQNTIKHTIQNKSVNFSLNAIIRNLLFLFQIKEILFLHIDIIYFAFFGNSRYFANFYIEISFLIFMKMQIFYVLV